MPLPRQDMFDCTRIVERDRAYEWNIARAPVAPDTLDVVIVSETHVELRIHYAGNGNIPCLKEGCPYCEKTESRFRAYVLAVEHLTGRRLLVEMPLTPWLKVEAACAAQGVLRGIKLRLFRSKPGKQAQVDGEVRGVSLSTSALPVATDPWPELCKLWKLDRSKTRASSNGSPSVKIPTDTSPKPRAPRKRGKTLGQEVQELRQVMDELDLDLGNAQTDVA